MLGFAIAYALPFTTVSVSHLMSELNDAGECKNNHKVIELWHLAESNNLNRNNECLRHFLYWFSSLGQIQYTLDVMSSLVPNVTTDDTLQLLKTYKNAKDHTNAQYALQLLEDNQFELNRAHFDILIATTASNGELSSIANILSIMKSAKHNLVPTLDTFDVIFENLENYYQKKKYLLSNVDIHGMVERIERDLFGMCADIRKSDKHIVSFMKWYCEFGDVSNAFSLSETVSFQTHALRSDLLEQLAMQQISLLFKNKINLSKAVSLLNEVLKMQNNNSVYSVVNLDRKSKKIIRITNSARHIFELLKSYHKLCDVNIVNLLLHISYLSNDLHSAVYILDELYLEKRNKANYENIEPNHTTIQYISKLFALANDNSVFIQPRTVEWSVSIYEWLLHKYAGNEYIIETLSPTTQNLLRLLANDTENIQYFVHVLRCAKNVISGFECEPKVFSLLGKAIVNKHTNLSEVCDKTIDIYGFMLASRDDTAEKAKKISSVMDRARLLGSVLTEYDANICQLYQTSIGGAKQPYFQIRRDLQQQFVLRLHRKYSLADILTLDVLKVSQTKTIGTTALTTDSCTEEL